jgi:hypothetical protein
MPSGGTTLLYQQLCLWSRQPPLTAVSLSDSEGCIHRYIMRIIRSTDSSHMARKIILLLQVYKDLKGKAVILYFTKGPDLKFEQNILEHKPRM